MKDESRKSKKVKENEYFEECMKLIEEQRNPSKKQRKSKKKKVSNNMSNMKSISEMISDKIIKIKNTKYCPHLLDVRNRKKPKMISISALSKDELNQNWMLNK